MQMLDATIDSCRALVIDPNPTSRSILTAQLRDLGVGTVQQCGRVSDARRHLELREFDIVLCEMDFPLSAQTGQELLDELRRNQLLPLSTVFVMVTAESSYARVAEAAESALDSYLLKPFPATALAERLMMARRRKRVLADIFTAIEAGELELAAGHCMTRFKSRGAYWLYAARIGAELMLRLGQHEIARELLEAVLETRALPWARLGIARAQAAQGETGPALRTLESLISDEPTYADAYDVMGRLHVEQGNVGDALETYRRAAALTPGSICRLQKFGMLAYYSGEFGEAAEALDRATLIGLHSKMFDYQTLVLLAFTRFHQRDGKAMQRCLGDLHTALERAPQSRRLERFAAVVHTVVQMQQRQAAVVVAEVKRQVGEIMQPTLDIEAACNLLALLALLTSAELNLPGAEDWVQSLALRFCTSRGVAELLTRTAALHPPFADQVREAQAEITRLNERSVMLAVNGDPQGAIQTLVSHARRTRNPRFNESARGLLQRHEARIGAAAAELRAACESLREELGAPQAAPRLGQEAAGQRQAGGVLIPGLG